MKVGDFLDKMAGAKTLKSRTDNGAKSTEVRVPPTGVSKLPLTKFALAAAVIGVSFYAGMAYQNSRQSAPAASALGTNGSGSQNQNQTGMGGGGFGNGSSGFGGYGRFGGSSISTSTVTAVSSTSITTAKDSSGNSNTYSITSDTVITDGGSQVAASDIQTGDSVIIIPERGDTSTARRIIVNPDFGQSQNGGQPMQVDPGETELN